MKRINVNHVTFETCNVARFTLQNLTTHTICIDNIWCTCTFELEFFEKSLDDVCKLLYFQRNRKERLKIFFRTNPVYSQWTNQIVYNVKTRRWTFYPHFDERIEIGNVRRQLINYLPYL